MRSKLEVLEEEYNKTASKLQDAESYREVTMKENDDLRKVSSPGKALLGAVCWLHVVRITTRREHRFSWEVRMGIQVVDADRLKI